MANVVITGASRGLGLALARGVIEPGDRAWLISRTEPPGCDGQRLTWIPLDLSEPRRLGKTALDCIGDEPLHRFIYCAGIWETEPFEKDSPEALLDILNTNLSSAVLLVYLLETNLRAGRGNIVFIGSTWGLENARSNRVASSASKFGLRGASQALREHFRDAMVRVSCINPGWFSADAARDKGAIPMEDIVELVKCILKLSATTCVKELVVTATADQDI